MRRAYLESNALAVMTEVLISEQLEPLAYVERAPCAPTSSVRLVVRESALGTAVLEAYLASKKPILEPVQEVARHAGEWALGLVTFGEPARVQRAVRALAHVAPSARCWGAPFRGTDALVLEAVPANGTKGAALRAVAEALGLAPRDTVAVGDNLNDLDMLQAAGVAVAMGNAVEEAKRMAAWTTVDNDSAGVAAVIARVLEINS